MTAAEIMAGLFEGLIIVWGLGAVCVVAYAILRMMERR